MKIKYLKTIIRVSVGIFLLNSFISCKDDETLELDESNCNEIITIPSSNAPFSDDLEDNEPFSKLTGKWTSIREDGAREFIVRTNQGNNFAEMSSFNSGEKNETWLISPMLDFSTMVDKNMSFTLADALQNGNPLKLIYSTSYDGSQCPDEFSWTEIGSTQIASLINNSENDDFVFEATGDIDLSEIEENAVIAFKYQGSSNGIITKIQLDNIRIGQSLAFVPTVEITGILEVRETLTANYSPLIDVVGNPISVNYQWVKADDIEGTNLEFISGATNEMYTLTNLDSGKFFTVIASANGQDVFATVVGPVTGMNTPPEAEVSILGIPEVGEVLTADTSGSSDIDGDPLTYTYQWYRADDIGGTNAVEIIGEINETYTVVASDLGSFISVKVVANDGELDSLDAIADYVGIAYSKNLFISEIADPNNNTRGRYVELFNSGTSDLDLAGWKIIRYTNGGTTPSAEEHILVGTIIANSTFVIGKVSDPTTTTDDFESIFGFAPDQAADPHSDGTTNKVVTPIDSNGDDQILLIAPDGSTMDIFGVIGEDGTGTAHEFEDGKAVRLTAITQSNPIWDAAEWEVYNDSGGNGTINSPQNAPSDFTPGVR